MRALETTGTIDAQHHLHLDHILPIKGPSRVKVIVLLEDENNISEKEWLQMAATNPAFDDLHNEHENIYSLSDGKPFHD